VRRASQGERWAAEQNNGGAVQHRRIVAPGFAGSGGASRSARGTERRRAGPVLERFRALAIAPCDCGVKNRRANAGKRVGPRPVRWVAAHAVTPRPTGHIDASTRNPASSIEATPTPSHCPAVVPRGQLCRGVRQVSSHRNHRGGGDREHLRVGHPSALDGAGRRRTANLADHAVTPSFRPRIIAVPNDGDPVAMSAPERHVGRRRALCARAGPGELEAVCSQP